MRKYKVNVNGTLYEVELEEISADEKLSAPAAASVAPAPAASAESAPGGEVVKSPMPGTISVVNASVGADVKRGDVLMILEAMKMENEICSPRDGKIVTVNVAKGASVETGTVLCTLA